MNDELVPVGSLNPPIVVNYLYKLHLRRFAAKVFFEVVQHQKSGMSSEMPRSLKKSLSETSVSFGVNFSSQHYFETLAFDWSNIVIASFEFAAKFCH